MTAKYNWPSREEWAYRRQHPPYEHYPENPVGRRLSDFATAEEIATLLFDLKVMWHEKGRAMAKAKAAAGPLARQPGETRGAYRRRWCNEMTEAEQNISSEPERLRDARQRIKILANPAGHEWLYEQAIDHPLLKEFQARWRQAYDEAMQAWLDERAKTPVDDEAWEAELRRRARAGSHWLMSG